MTSDMAAVVSGQQPILARKHTSSLTAPLVVMVRLTLSTVICFKLVNLSGLMSVCQAAIFEIAEVLSCVAPGLHYVLLLLTQQLV